MLCKFVGNSWGHPGRIDDGRHCHCNDGEQMNLFVDVYIKELKSNKSKMEEGGGGGGVVGGAYSPFISLLLLLLLLLLLWLLLFMGIGCTSSFPSNSALTNKQIIGCQSAGRLLFVRCGIDFDFLIATIWFQLANWFFKNFRYFHLFGDGHLSGFDRIFGSFRDFFGMILRLLDCQIFNYLKFQSFLPNFRDFWISRYSKI